MQLRSSDDKVRKREKQLYLPGRWGIYIYLSLRWGLPILLSASFVEEEEMTERQEKEKLRSRSFGNLSLFIHSSASWHDFRDLEGRNGGCGVGLIVVVKACIAANAASL